MLGRAQLRHGLRLPVEMALLILGPPRTGKTGLLGSIVMHYPGPAMSTSTKPDVFAATSGARQALGPVHIFNPQGIGGVLSTFRWNPLDGCQSPAVAIRRADGFANALQMGDGDNAFFQNAARGYLRAMFHAAALVRGGDMRLVSQWALTGTQGGAVQAEHVLRQNGAGPWADELSQLRGAAEKTSATNEMVLGQALGFMADPALARSVLPAAGTGIDFAQFLRGRGSLYLIADSASEQSPLAPLFAALASEVHYSAVLAGQASPGGRLDPPLLMALDEVTQICPVPAPQWASDSGGKGIQLVTVAHGEAQLVSRWGEAGKQVLLDTASCLMALPGIKDTGTLEMLGKLCGQAAYREHGQEHLTRHDVMTPDMTRQILPGRALVIQGGVAPVIARLPRYWKDRAFKRLARRGAAAAVLRPVWDYATDERVIISRVTEPVAARLRPADPFPDPVGAREFADVLPADDVARPWRSR
jgi:type IV secretory pathway TraG/TraD family ATPase VirD4